MMHKRTESHSLWRTPWYTPFVPPGMNMEGELIFFFISMLAALSYSVGFLIRLYGHIELLYTRTDDVRTLIPGAVMAPFYEVFDRAWLGYFIVLLCMLGWGIYHAAYYRQGANNIYLMRRLPDRISYYRYTWTTTVCAVVLCLIFAAICLLLSYGIYHWTTPEECLADGQWTLFWKHLFARQ